MAGLKKSRVDKARNPANQRVETVCLVLENILRQTCLKIETRSRAEERISFDQSILDAAAAGAHHRVLCAQMT
jgi:hypothetical protein